MKLSEITEALEQYAPKELQESYDNSGLLIGDLNRNITGAVICLDSIEAVVDEAIAKKSNLIIAHHPIVFKGLKSITGKNYIERTILKAIKHDIAIYAIHTNLDNINQGVNAKIGALLGIKKSQILQPKKGMIEKLVTYAPTKYAAHIQTALFDAGAGGIGNYSECSFKTIGSGSFKAGTNAKPFVGEKDKRHNEEETKIEVVYESFLRKGVLNNLEKAHPYEEVAYELYTTLNTHQNIGAGMFGDMDEEISVIHFFDQLKKTFNLKSIRHTPAHKEKIKRIAWCGGSGSFLLNEAKKVKADIFITGDFKYHDFFDHEKQLIIADIGHYESEQFTIDLIGDFLKEKFPKFAVHLTEVNTNPVNYY